jgi:hypothetical protein
MDGWLRTGDVGYIDADGYVFLVDHQDLIICSGFNITRAPLRSASEHPAVDGEQRHQRLTISRRPRRLREVEGGRYRDRQELKKFLPKAQQSKCRARLSSRNPAQDADRQAFQKELRDEYSERKEHRVNRPEPESRDLCDRRSRARVRHLDARHPLLRVQGPQPRSGRGTASFAAATCRLMLILRGKRLGFSLRDISDYLSLYDAHSHTAQVTL